MQIKIRFWDVEEKKMFYQIESFKPGYPAEINSVLWQLYKRGEVMLSTGIFDVKGEEIWQGDIVQLPPPSVGSEPRTKFQVIWDEEHAGFRLRSIEELSYIGDLSSEMAVLGNVWENVDLIH